MKIPLQTALTLIVLATVTNARADILTYSDIEAVTPWNPVIPVGFNIPRLNPADGTLNSVSLTLSGYINSSFSGSLSGSGGLTVWQQFILSAVYNGSDVLAQRQDIFTSPNYPTPVPLPYNGVMTWSSTLSQSQFTFSSAADLANFTGTGNIPLIGECDYIHSEKITGATGGGWSSVASSHLVAVVVYNFTPVPEPPVAGLWIIPGMALMFYRRRLRAVHNRKS